MLLSAPALISAYKGALFVIYMRTHIFAHIKAVLYAPCIKLNFYLHVNIFEHIKNPFIVATRGLVLYVVHLATC